MFSKGNTMKVLIALICMVFLFGCGFIGIKEVEDPICPLENSWICEQSENIGVQPETVYGFIYSASAISVITNVAEKSEICDFEQKIADWYVDVYPVTYDSIIKKVSEEAGLIKETEKALLIKNILNKNLVIYKSNSLISDADDSILRKGHKTFRQDMLCD